MEQLSDALVQTRERLTQQFGERVSFEESFRGALAVRLAAADLLEVVGWLREAEGLKYRQLSDVTAVDYLSLGRVPRFDVVYHVVSNSLREWLRLKVGVDEAEPVPSLTGLWRGASYMEREVFDMFGIPIEGHPRLERILMPDDYIGHPLRKDHPIGEIPVEFDIPHRKRFGHA